MHKKTHLSGTCIVVEFLSDLYSSIWSFAEEAIVLLLLWIWKQSKLYINVIAKILGMGGKLSFKNVTQ